MSVAMNIEAHDPVHPIKSEFVAENEAEAVIFFGVKLPPNIDE
jgi:hypothetical protein